MKILQIHNHYQHRTGGEFVTAEMDKILLESNGHQVIRYIRNNDEIKTYTLINKIKLLFNSIWSQKAYNDIRKIIINEKPDILHMHNYSPLISPSAFYVAKKFNLGTVWTLNNYRLICVEGQFLRNNKVCELCLHKSRIYSLIHGCYRKSRLASFIVFMVNFVHSIIGTWEKKVDIYLPLTEFGKKVFEKGGINKHKLVIKANVIYPEPVPRDQNDVKDYVLFLGQLSSKKGIENLVELWGNIDFKLIVAGDGPLRSELEEKTKVNNSNIEFIGAIDHKNALDYLRNAKFLVLPSLHNEGFPLVISEALALGVPIITSNSGPLPELVIDHYNGLLVKPGNKDDLFEKICYALNNNNLLLKMGQNSRKLYEQSYSAKENYEILMSAYKKALNHDN